MPQNKAWTLESYPTGWVGEENFRLVAAPAPEPGEGEALVKNLWLSLDPYMRGRISPAKSYVKGVSPGEVMVGQTVGEVVASRHPGLKPGDKLLTQLGWQLYGVVRADDLGRSAIKVAEGRVPLSYYLGILGMPGMTAYFGLKEIGQPKAGETLVVSAASGAVGSIVGQLAELAGARAVGIAGGREKCDYVTRELGFDACIDYKAEDLRGALERACPRGIDVYFDNVGGEMLDTVLAQTNVFSRIVVCGMVSQYNATEPYALKNLRYVLTNRIRMQGMIVFDWKDRYGEALAALSEHVAKGKLKYRESVVQGLENAPRGLIDLLQGKNFGKQLVKL
jgi:NADPH-dependent curcumin reductase